jgi:4-diphosphocytidyl-2-C-methyl-D-erythritol kinase
MSEWREAAAPAKLNLALVVGPRRADGRHEVVTVLERLALADTIAVRRAPETRVSGFEGDTLVGDALDGLASEAGATAHFEARIEKRIPVATGLGGGSSDAATALLLANDLLNEPLSADRLVRLASRLGADVPFFLHGGSQLATEDGTALEPIRLARGYAVVLVLPHGVEKESTRAVYEAFDARGGEAGFDERRAKLHTALAGVRTETDLAALPRNDLASSPLAAELERLGAFRADVTGAGPVAYGLFLDTDDAVGASSALADRGQTWVTRPV